MFQEWIRHRYGVFSEAGFAGDDKFPDVINVNGEPKPNVGCENLLVDSRQRPLKKKTIQQVKKISRGFCRTFFSVDFRSKDEYNFHFPLSASFFDQMTEENYHFSPTHDIKSGFLKSELNKQNKHVENEESSFDDLGVVLTRNIIKRKFIVSDCETRNEKKKNWLKFFFQRLIR